MIQTRHHAVAAEERSDLDVDGIREDFPILQGTEGGVQLVYLDNAATTQKPKRVIESIGRYYASQNANIHRGVYRLSQSATDAYEGARRKVQGFLNAGAEDEIVFVRGTTEAINLVANTLGRTLINSGDEVLISAMEHHSNIVPWQLVTEQIGANIRVIPMDETGTLDLDAYESSFSSKTKLVSIVHVSNSLGTVNPVREMTKIAHDHGIPVLVDGAQAASHMKIDVREIGCDFYALSGHKMFGPTGIGVLFGRANMLAAMPPYQGGGDMVRTVTFEKTRYADPPTRFEGGTPNIAGAIGLGAAIDYLDEFDWAKIQNHEKSVVEYAIRRLSEVPGLKIIGTPASRAGVVSFTIEGIHPHDIGTILDNDGIAIRTGHHCTQPVMDYYGIPATARASFAFYNTILEVDALIDGLSKVREVFV